jgi:membrane protease YdiL (CAAX protease family)
MGIEVKEALIRVIPFFLILIGLSIGIKKKKISTQELYINKPVSHKAVMSWLIGFLLCVAAFESTLYQLGLLNISSWKHDLLSSIIRITGMVILAPIAEELIFRGLILSKLRKLKISKLVAIVLQAVLFVALHSVYDFTISSQIGMLQLFIDAIIFAYAMYHTKSIYTPILLHAAGNLVAVLEQFLV